MTDQRRLDEGLDRVRLIEAFYRSAEQGREVDVELDSETAVATQEGKTG